jgi:hypothetical protein
MKYLAFSVVVVLLTRAGSNASAQTTLFEDTFDGELSEQWQVTGLSAEDYRIRDGGLELRVRPEQPGNRPMLHVNLPFGTDGTVEASVEVTVEGKPLGRNEMAGLCLTDQDGSVFSVRKTNIDGYFVFAPGEPEFIGKAGQEGDPGRYAVKYWPAEKDAGPLRIIVRGHYAFFQVGPSPDGKYRTIFHSAIQEAQKGLGFGLFAVGSATDSEERWVRFDNLRIQQR